MNKRQAKKKRKKRKEQLIFPMLFGEFEEYWKAKVRVVYTPRQLVIGTFDNKHWMKEYFQRKSAIPQAIQGLEAKFVVIDEWFGGKGEE